MRKKFPLLILLCAIIVVLGVGYVKRNRVAQVVVDLRKPTIPAAVSIDAFVTSSPPVAPATTTPKTITPQKQTPTAPPVEAKKNPDQLNLAVPFAMQAPYQNWVGSYEDGCEEASAAMVHYFYSKKNFSGPAAVDEELKKLFAWEDAAFGNNFDTTAEQTARMLKEFYGYKRVDVVYDFSAEDVRVALRAGRPVIIPAFGKALQNPNFRNGGPDYHMLVIKGYIGEKTFITNDPGTRKGADYVYSTSVIVNAAHDWNDGDVQSGKRVMIVVFPEKV